MSIESRQRQKEREAKLAQCKTEGLTMVKLVAETWFVRRSTGKPDFQIHSEYTLGIEEVVRDATRTYSDCQQFLFAQFGMTDSHPEYPSICRRLLGEDVFLRAASFAKQLNDMVADANQDLLRQQNCESHPHHQAFSLVEITSTEMAA